MALQPNFTFEQQCNCKEVLFNDTTGVYSFPGNQGGYGVQTTQSLQITNAKLEIKKTTWDNPIYIDFVINVGVITSATVTNQFNQVRSITNSLSNLVFPFVNQIFDSTILYDTNTAEPLETGAYFVTYSVGYGSFNYTYEKWFFFVCKYNSCVEEAGIKLAKGQITKAKAQEIFLTYDLIFLNVGLQKVTEVEKQIEAMDLLCDECGCCH
jgi:uncharacterized membrane protein